MAPAALDIARPWPLKVAVDNGLEHRHLTGWLAPMDRCFDAPTPNRRWAADITYVDTLSGWVYTAFVMDLFARRILGWQAADHLRSDLALDALKMAIWARRHESIGRLAHHSDRSVQHTSIRYTERLAEAKAVRSVGSKGDSYDNVAAEALNSLYKRVAYRPVKGPGPGDDHACAKSTSYRVLTCPRPISPHGPVACALPKYGCRRTGYQSRTFGCPGETILGAFGKRKPSTT